MERPPTADRLLDVWEQGRSQTPVQRANALLALAAPEADPAELARYGIGRRDQELLRLREQLFGPRMTAVAHCPACGLEIEMDFSVTDLCVPQAADSAQLHQLQIAGHEVRFHLPTCDDLAAVELDADASARKSALLRRCVAEVRMNGAPVAIDPLPEVLATALSVRMAELDPQGDIELSLSCPACNRHWQTPLDIVSYVWSEVQAWAERLLRDVHALAAAYGWREADILAMSPWRREAYLELIRQ